jgi:cysteine-rich repeat protein
VVVCAGLLSCQRDKDSYIVVHSDVSCDVPRVYQLRLTVSNDGRADQKTIPEVPGAELGFPSSTTLIVPGTRRGVLTILVEAIDDRHQLVGEGGSAAEIEVGGRVDVDVRITAVHTAACGNAVLEDGEQCDDGNRSSGDGCSHSCRFDTPSVDGGLAHDVGAGVDPELAGSAIGGASFAFGALGARSTCAVGADTSLWCWGDNLYGQLRLAGASGRFTPAGVASPGFGAVACGQSHACGTRLDGTLSCWGNNASGQLGAATPTPSGQQVEVPGGPWASVSTGSYQTCAVAGDTSLWCWGNNANGQLGIGSTVDSSRPAQVAGVGWTQVCTGYLHTCAVKQDGTLWCWGMNANYQLGDATVAFRMTPGQVPTSTWTQVTTGLYHTCATRQDGSLWCWGGNTAGQLGVVSAPVQPNAKFGDALQVPGTWRSVAAGQTHTCGIMTDRSLWCWGENGQGQLGDGSQFSRGTPVSVVAPGRVWAWVGAGLAHTCAVATTGEMWCWGANEQGQLGIGTNEPRRIPAQVAQ